MYNCSTNVTRVISWGNSNVLLTNMDSAFSRCVNLIEIPNDDYESFINVSSFKHIFLLFQFGINSRKFISSLL